jgi:hypothetical protein
MSSRVVEFVAWDDGPSMQVLHTQDQKFLQAPQVRRRQHWIQAGVSAREKASAVASEER